MDTRKIPITVLDVIDMLISGREKLAKELINELQQYEYQNKKRRLS